MDTEVLFCQLLNGQCFKITNLKVSLRRKLCLKDLQQARDKLLYKGATLRGRSHNFITFTSSSYVYTLFSSGHVNITGLQKERDILPAVNILRELLPEETITVPNNALISLDNLSVSGRLREEGTIKYRFAERLESFCQEHDLMQCRAWNPEVFAGYTIRTPHGTLVIFPSGAINILGIKEFRQCEFFESALNSLLIKCAPEVRLKRRQLEEKEEHVRRDDIAKLWKMFVESNV